MTVEDNDTPASISSGKRQARRLRMVAMILLALGIFGANLVYWLGTRSPVDVDTLPVVGEDKAETRKAETLFGRQSVMLDELNRNLKRPATQAIIIVITGALASGGCFYVARVLDRAGE